MSEVFRPPPLQQLQTIFYFFCNAFFSTLNAVIQYKMQYNIWPTFSKRKGSIVNSRHIGNKVTHLQTTLGAGTYGILDQTSRLKQTIEEKTKLKFNHVDI